MGLYGNCSFCAVRKAIGQFHSKPYNVCLKEFKRGLKDGYKNFIILADDIGSYGVDINKNIIDLLDRITKIDGDYSIEIMGIHPKWIVKYIDGFEEK
ncbi:MAG: hypothetical protein V5A64_03830 [Candidatus Thermoplasmatota archaeon]